MKKTAKLPKYKIMTIDPLLKPYYNDIALRMNHRTSVREKLLGNQEDIRAFANGYLYYGFQRTQTGWIYREWAPGADEIHLFGDFNNWDRKSHPMTKDENGVWEIRLEGENALQHGQQVKIQVTKDGKSFDRIPAYIHRVLQQPETAVYNGQIWMPPHPFQWTDGGYGKRKNTPPVIYEAHIGMAQEREGIGTYAEFADLVLPRIGKLGYNTIQLMGIMEHPYYGSFGYQVTNFYAPSSRYGTPDDLKYLINKAHEMGISVLLDIVHSHASANAYEGLNLLDGTEDQYFHPGQRGWHPAWGTKVFNYGKHEVIHFLLSNLKYWLEEYHFDGFRFDGVTSMIYMNHGINESFVDYSQYFSMNTDIDAITYLQLANELVNAVNPFAITIAEEMSGMPGMALPIRSGGIGFNYRLSMGLPDYWIRTLKTLRDDEWDLYKLWYELTTRRPDEKNIGYCESHDQALVGDKTLFFRMTDAEIYDGMNVSYHSATMDRAVALHKMIRFITLTLAGEGYLNFMGNEFGHPEWIDFPRAENGWSHKYARRQWHLVDDPNLKYAMLNAFDVAMLKFIRKYRVLSKTTAINRLIDQNNKVLAYEKGDFFYVFNFNPSDEIQLIELPLRTDEVGTYKVMFSSDESSFGGFDRVREGNLFIASADTDSLTFVLPSRVTVVLQKQ